MILWRNKTLRGKRRANLRKNAAIVAVPAAIVGDVKTQKQDAVAVAADAHLIGLYEE